MNTVHRIIISHYYMFFSNFSKTTSVTIMAKLGAKESANTGRFAEVILQHSNGPIFFKSCKTTLIRTMLYIVVKYMQVKKTLQIK